MPSSKYTKCTYLKRDGSVCGKGSVGGICGGHMRCNLLHRCRLCGRGTQSASGICGAPGECRKAQHAATVRFLRVEGPAPPPVTSDDLDTLVDELLAIVI